MTRRIRTILAHPDSAAYVSFDAHALQAGWDEFGRTVEAGRHTIQPLGNGRHPAANRNNGALSLGHSGKGNRARWRAAWIKPAELLRSMPSEELVGMALFVLAFPALFFAFALVTP